MSETASPRRRGGRLLRTGGALVVLLAVAAYVAVTYLTSQEGIPRCVVRATDPPDGTGRSYEMTPEQAANAATISAVGTTRGMPERAVTIALATAMQESALRNLAHGDRDSLGLFQQRPSKGWGTPAQIQDPVYAANEFYEHLAEVRDYPRLPLTEAAQRVQRSGFPDAYAKHEPDAALLAASLTGRSAASLTCSAPDGRPGDPAKVRAELVRAFGSDVLPAGAGAAVTSSAGDVIAVPVREVSGGPGGVPEDGTDAGRTRDPSGVEAMSGISVGARAGAGDKRAEGAGDGTRARRGWELAQWAVAHSFALRIDEVAYADRFWRAEESYKGWQRRGGQGSAGKPSTPSGASGASSASNTSAASGTEEVRIRTAR
ncbi:hypothetical protein [Streptomyces sp. NRRL F-5135]|uniref:hypothetical protein n=1 Tax=Streptomyces sp. NRRL F-5135 TaxID=1463858 RepID=UPI0004C6BE55|nr:hypothetical protein [Streptomyces sp. NRRL F-5135]